VLALALRQGLAVKKALAELRRLGSAKELVLELKPVLAVKKDFFSSH